MNDSESSPWRRTPGWFQILLLVAPALSVIAALALAGLYLDGYLWATGEDGPIEWLTVVCYLAATVLAIRLIPRWWSHGRDVAAWAYAILALGFIVIAGEEISWGQRIFGFEGPSALIERNVQSEANLHNLLEGSLLHALYITVGLWGVGVGRYVMLRLGSIRPWYAFAPSREVRWWFVPVLAYYVYVDYGMPLLNALPVAATFGPGPNRFQEPVELLLAMGFVLFVAEAWVRSGASVRAAGSSTEPGVIDADVP